MAIPRRKRLSELTDYFYNELHGDLKKLEVQRKELASRVLYVGLVIAFFAVLLTYALFFKSTHAHSEADLLPLLAGGGLFFFIKKHMSSSYAYGFKEKIIRPLIKEIDEALQYHRSHHVSQSYFERSRLFRKEIDRYSGNDLVRGEIEGVKLQFSDVHAQYRSRNSKGRSSWHTIFQGLFIVADFNKHFKGHTAVFPDRAEKVFGRLIGSWLQKQAMQREKLVKMDDPEFEKHFVVYGSDQIESRYILTHAMMKRLLDYKKRSKVPLYVSFSESQIYLALEHNKDLFEPTLFTSLLDYALIKEYVSTLQLAVGIIDELKLNERLWSKQ
jgi:hypothetical protein